MQVRLVRLTGKIIRPWIRYVLWYEANNYGNFKKERRMKYCSAFFAFIITAYLLTTGCATVPKTPLIEAASKGDFVTTQKLVKEGANIDEPDGKGATPLMHAVWSGKTETVEALINMGADINKRDSYGYTPLLTSLSYGYIAVARLLIDKGADINAVSDDGSSALLLSIGADNTELASLLIDRGVDINAEDSGGTTPIIQAAMQGNYEVAEKLIGKNVDVFAVDASGYKASDYAGFSLRAAKRIFNPAGYERSAALFKLLKKTENTQIAAGRLNTKNRLIARIFPLVYKVKTCMAPDTDYAVYISPQKELNAWVNVSGNITFTKGALENFDDYTLTLIAAHEIAHDKLGHVADKMAVSYTTTGVMIVAGALVPGLGLLNYVVNPAVTNNYSKIQEYEADKLASEFCAKCFGMSIEKQTAIMLSIKAKAEADGGGFWASHPAWKDRIENIKK